MCQVFARLPSEMNMRSDVSLVFQSAEIVSIMRDARTVPYMERNIATKRVSTYDLLFFSRRARPMRVYIVVDGKPVFYKRCETPEIARAVVDGQNNSRRIDQ